MPVQKENRTGPRVGYKFCSRSDRLDKNARLDTSGLRCHNLSGWLRRDSETLGLGWSGSIVVLPRECE